MQPRAHLLTARYPRSGDNEIAVATVGCKLLFAPPEEARPDRRTVGIFGKETFISRPKLQRKRHQGIARPRKTLLSTPQSCLFGGSQQPAPELSPADEAQSNVIFDLAVHQTPDLIRPSFIVPYRRRLSERDVHMATSAANRARLSMVWPHGTE